MKSFRTEVEVKEHSLKIDYDTPVVFLGSCFATNIGNQFIQNRLNVLVNPNGVIYNPISVANTLKSIVQKQMFAEHDLNFYGEHWHSFLHHSSFSHSDKESCLRKINAKNAEAYDYLRKSRFLFITFGTAWVYQWADTEMIVSNCHKYPSGFFNRYLLNIEEIVDEYKQLLTELLVFNPNIQVVFTVSPVRHWKDGANGNQISKATLLLAIKSITEQFESCHYFPAYELLMDDLRDYRFYDDDMLHPAPVAIEYIWEKFKNCFFSANTLQYIKEMAKLEKANQHIPFNPNSESYQKFLRTHLHKVNQLEIKYPNRDFNADLEFFKSKII